MQKMSGLDRLVMILVIIGAVNWGLVGAFNFNLVDIIFGGWPSIVRIVYVIVGLSGLYALANLGKKGGELEQ